jgi:hypothetical protein
MSIYKLTVFEPSGEKVMDESIEAANDDIAKEMGSKLLKEKGYEETTHRLTSPVGKLILFHR